MRSDSEMKGIRQRLRPLLTPATPFLLPCRCQLCGSWLICFRWRAGSTHWFSSVLSKKKKKKILIYSYTGAWMRLIPPVSKSGMVGKGVILPTPINKINDPQYHFRNKSISSATKWILIRYNETWVWLELFQEACCTRHCQRVAARLVISQLGQDKPHTVNIPDGEHPHVSSILLANVRLYYLIQFLMISRTDRWIDSVLVLKNGSRCHMVAV